MILAFYPGDFTAVCTKQFCSYRDDGERIDRLGAEMLGISPQSVDSHERFTSEHGLNVPLLADEDRSVAKAYGVTAGPLVRRSIFLIDEEGVIRYRHVARLGLGYKDVDDLEQSRGRGRLMRPPMEPVPFSAGEGLAIRGEELGGGGAADRPLPRDHGDPALRRPRLEGPAAQGLPAGHLRRPRRTASPTRPRRARVMDTRSWSATSTR